MQASEICSKLKALGNRQRALATQRFFKTGPGQYGEGDIFAGLTVPEVRKLAKEYQALPLGETRRLLQSRIHEARLLALLILIRAYKKGDPARQEWIYHLYLKNTRFINN